MLFAIVTSTLLSTSSVKKTVLQTEIEVDNNKVYELIRILKDLQDYEAIGKQLEGTEIRFYTASALCISECVLVCQRV